MNNHKRHLITLNLGYIKPIAIGIMLEGEKEKHIKTMLFETICEKYAIKSSNEVRDELDNFRKNWQKDDSYYNENSIIRIETDSKNDIAPNWYCNKYAHLTELRYLFSIKDRLLAIKQESREI